MNYISTVTGNIPWQQLGITDAHNHVWIDLVPGANPNTPVLNDFLKALCELKSYKLEGGKTILDCQPGGCGRNGKMLARLSFVTGVTIVSATGFHRPVYYPPDFWLFSADEERITRWFIDEIVTGETETHDLESPVHAGFIKIACENTLSKTYQPALRAAALAVCETGKCISIHTEKGQSASEILDFFIRSGVNPRQIVLCHMDKLPDAGLHRELAQAGVALEYDTFFRSKYKPEIYLWPLITTMVESGFDDHLCLATDMAESDSWSSYNNGPGLVSLPSVIKDRLVDMGFSTDTIDKLTGKNIVRILSNTATNE